MTCRSRDSNLGAVFRYAVGYNCYFCVMSCVHRNKWCGRIFYLDFKLARLGTTNSCSSRLEQEVCQKQASSICQYNTKYLQTTCWATNYLIRPCPKERKKEREKPQSIRSITSHEQQTETILLRQNGNFREGPRISPSRPDLVKIQLVYLQSSQTSRRSSTDCVSLCGASG